MQILFVHSKVCLYLWKQGLWHPIFEYEMNAIFKFFCGRCSFLVAQFDYSRILKSSYFFLEQLKPFTESYIIFFIQTMKNTSFWGEQKISMLCTLPVC